MQLQKAEAPLMSSHSQRHLLQQGDTMAVIAEDASGERPPEALSVILDTCR